MKFYRKSNFKNAFKLLTFISLYNSVNGATKNITNNPEKSVVNEKHDCDYLKVVYKELGMPNKWKSSECCNINTVKCDINSKIIEISLGKSSAYGQISNDIGYLTSLQTLDLNNNNIYGGIPNTIGKLENLVTLSLDHNSISGKIPIELCDLANLKMLNLGYNKLFDPIPDEIGSLINLQTLNLESNDLSGAIPKSLNYLKNLTNVNLSNNVKLEGALPQLEFVTICNYENTSLCYINEEECKSNLTECTDEQNKNTEIARIKQSSNKIEEEEEEKFYVLNFSLLFFFTFFFLFFFIFFL